MAAYSSDLVKDSRFETDFLDADVVTTRHTFVTSDPSARRRQVRREETWSRTQQLGSGTFGTVWRERCVLGKRKGQFRAVKEVLKVQSGSPVVDYSRELEVLAKFSHERYQACFVRLDGWFQNDTAIFIAMEYLERGDLQRYLTRPFPESEARLIASQLVEGISHMHANGFAHRDLKPANILVVDNQPDSWWVKLSDFGVSKRATQDTTLRTMVGTRHYLAPELLTMIVYGSNSDQPCDVSVDIWSLGQIVYYMITGKLAFSGGETGDLYKYTNNGAAFPEKPLIDIGASEPCCRLVVQSMALNPDERPKASELLAHEWLQQALSITVIADETEDYSMLSESISALDLGSLHENAPEPTLSQASATWTTETSMAPSTGWTRVPSPGMPEFQTDAVQPQPAADNSTMLASGPELSRAVIPDPPVAEEKSAPEISVRVGIAISNSNVRVAWALASQPYNIHAIEQWPEGSGKTDANEVGTAVPARVSLRRDGSVRHWGFDVSSRDPWSRWTISNCTIPSAVRDTQVSADPLAAYLDHLYDYVLSEIRTSLTANSYLPDNAKLVVDCVVSIRFNGGTRRLTHGGPMPENEPLQLQVIRNWREKQSTVRSLEFVWGRDPENVGMAFACRESLELQQPSFFIYITRNDIRVELSTMISCEPFKIKRYPLSKTLSGESIAVVRTRLLALAKDATSRVSKFEWNKRSENNLIDYFEGSIIQNLVLEKVDRNSFNIFKDGSRDKCEIPAEEIKTKVLDPTIKPILTLIKSQLRYWPMPIKHLCIVGGGVLGDYLARSARHYIPDLAQGTSTHSAKYKFGIAGVVLMAEFGNCVEYEG